MMVCYYTLALNIDKRKVMSFARKLNSVLATIYKILNYDVWIYKGMDIFFIPKLRAAFKRGRGICM